MLVRSRLLATGIRTSMEFIYTASCVAALSVVASIAMGALRSLLR